QERHEKERDKLDVAIALMFLADPGPNASPAERADFEQGRIDLHRELVAPRVLFLCAGAGVLGALLAMTPRRFRTAALLLIAGSGPMIFNPRLGIFSGLLLLAMILALFIAPRRRPAVI